MHSPTAIELALPAYMSRVHNVIHPEYIRLGHTNANGSYKKGVERGTGFRDVITAAFDMTTEYGIDEIVAHRHVGTPSDGNIEYLIRWENCSNLQVTWEPQAALIHAPRKVTAYQRKQGSRPRSACVFRVSNTPRLRAQVTRVRARRAQVECNLQSVQNCLVPSSAAP